jgi:hypothetical protein
VPTWGQLLQELNKLSRDAQTREVPVDGTSPYDILRRKYLQKLHDHTKRGTIVYATAWMENRPDVPGTAFSINLGDLQGFMEACSNVTERELDLIITSPGGSPEAAESLMAYLRTRFDHIRVIVPVAAMSAATMMALAADEIVMGSHSQLGPIDPQFTVFTPEGPRSAPGQAILDQFELAKQECQNPANIGAWLPILRSLLPGLIAQCGHQRDLAEQFATVSLSRYMFKGRPDSDLKAKTAAAWFSNFSSFKSHGRRVSREDARGLDLNVIDLEADQLLQDAILSVHHAVRHTFNGTGTNKIIENHHGRAYIEAVQQQVMQLVPKHLSAPPNALPAQPQNPLGAPLSPDQQVRNRADRRARGKKS